MSSNNQEPPQSLLTSTSAKQDDDIEIICNPQELVTLNSDLRKAKNQISILESEKHSQLEQVQKLQNSISQLTDELNLATSKGNEVEAVNLQMVQKLSELEIDNQSQKIKISELEEALVSQQSQINERQNLIEQQNETLKSLQAQNSSNEELISQLQQNIIRFGDINKTYTEEQASRKDLENINEKLKAQCISLQQELSVSIDACAASHKQVAKLNAEKQQCEAKNQTLIAEAQKTQEKTVAFENEMKKLQDIIEKARAESEKSKKLQQSFIRPSNQLTVSQIQNKEKSMISQFESLNQLLEEVESYKQQVLTYEDLFKNLDIELLLNSMIPKIEEQVQADPNPDKGQIRQKLLMEMALSMLRILQGELKQWKLELTYAISM